MYTYDGRLDMSFVYGSFVYGNFDVYANFAGKGHFTHIYIYIYLHRYTYDGHLVVFVLVQHAHMFRDRIHIHNFFFGQNIHLQFVTEYTPQ